MGAQKTFLIVDDNDAVRMILADMLESMGHKVVGEAPDMAGALKIYAEKKPDLVTLDLSLSALGGADGLTVLKALRKAHPEARVIIVSGNSQNKVREMLAAAGARAFVSKPIKEPDLAAAVAAAAA